MNAHDQPEKFQSADRTAGALGLPKAWLLREAESGRVPVLRVGRRRMFDIAAVRQALQDLSTEQRNTAGAQAGGCRMIARLPSESPDVATALLVDADGAARLCGVARSTWLKLQAQGRIPAARELGLRRLWSRSELQAWIDAGCPARDEWDLVRGEAR